jgi:hypothetical protein
MEGSDRVGSPMFKQFWGGASKKDLVQKRKPPLGSVYFYEKDHDVFGTKVTHLVSCRAITPVTKKEVSRGLLQGKSEHREIVDFIFRAEQRQRRQAVIKELLMNEPNYVITIHALIWSFPQRRVTLLHTGVALYRNGYDNRTIARRITDFLRWHLESLATGASTMFFDLEEREKLLTSSRIESKLHWLTSVCSKYYSEIKSGDDSRGENDRRKQ